MKNLFKKIGAMGLLLVLLAFNSNFVQAEVSLGSSLSSDNFKVLDSQHSVFGGSASSSSGSFNLQSTIGGLAIGSSSFTSFGLLSGFLYFPKVVAPVLNSATAGNAQVSLSWTAATAYQGWRIGGYNVCTSSGTYSCENVGNVTSFTKSALSNGTTYTFKIEARDGIGNVIAVSNELSATPSGVTPTPPPGGGGGGGGGGGYPPAPPPSTGTGKIILKGSAYPQSTVNAFLDGFGVATIRAGANAKFEITLNNIGAGTHRVELNSQDINGRRSVSSPFTVEMADGVTVTLTEILLAPTIDISARDLSRGDIVKIFGQAAPESEVNVHVFSDEQVSKVITDNAGDYSIRFDTGKLKEDDHSTKSRAVLQSVVSPFSQLLQFNLRGVRAFKTADLNKDGRVNIVDFSILLFWWNTKQAKGLDVADINDDGKVNVVDFSIMLFQWNG
ncbi:MAG: hypothetical protein KW806_00870 [Candidatus Yanofskybacteria bacterium]|nr:hypothetical protein [Candidatus Yanofskybacteria bacterium]